MFNPEMVASLQGALAEARNESAAVAAASSKKPQSDEDRAGSPELASFFDDVDHFEFGTAA